MSEKTTKVLTVELPTEVLNKFRLQCKMNYVSMSHKVRELILNDLKD